MARCCRKDARTDSETRQPLRQSPSTSRQCVSRLESPPNASNRQPISLERDAKTGQWRGAVPEMPGVNAVGRDIAEVRARLPQELRAEDALGEIEVHISW